MSNSQILYVGGGIGDFLQQTPYMLQNQNYIYLIHTHYQKAKQYFDHFNLSNILYLFYSDNSQRMAQLTNLNFNLIETPRNFFTTYKQSKENETLVKSLFKKEKPIIGIHPFGSSFSNSVYRNFNIPEKNISNEIIKEISKDADFNFLLFGSSNEINKSGLKEEENFKFIHFDNIIDSLMSVKSCCYFIGTDSCFKNMACMNLIKTFCLISDFKDDIRDELFINPYKEKNILTVFHSNNQEKDKIKILIEVENFLQK